jgi:hypothetical protein
VCYLFIGSFIDNFYFIWLLNTQELVYFALDPVRIFLVVEIIFVNLSFKQNNTIVCLFLINAGKKNLTLAKLLVPHGIGEMISESTMPW